MIISAFPGTGKSYFYEKYKDKISVSDSDSSSFSWLSDGVRNPEFPDNYISHIIENLGNKIMLVSSHSVVRERLYDYGLCYVLIYPHRSLKDVYLDSYKSRGSDSKFISLMSDHWDNFLDGIERESFPKKVELSEGKYVEDFVKLFMW